MEIIIDFSDIRNKEDFHYLFKKVMGFPEFYGNNMDAWIDCMSYIDSPDAQMSSILVSPNESLEVVLVNTKTSKVVPNLLQELVECTATVNQKFIESDSKTRIKIVAT